MSRIVFFSIPAHGHTNPTVEVVRTLVARGHRVRYYSFEEFRGRLEGAGAEFVPCDSYLPPAPRDVERRIGRDFASLIGMVVDVTVAMEERVLGELAAFRPHCIVADSLCIWGKLYAGQLGVPLVCSTTTFAFDQETAKGMRPRPGELLRTLAGVPRIGKKLALLRAHGYRAEKLTDLIQNDSSTDTIVYTSRAFQPGGERFGERVAFVGPVLPELPAPAERGNRSLIYVSLGTVMNRNARFYRNCAEALGGGPWDVLMSVGSGEQAAVLGPLPPQRAGGGPGGSAPGAPGRPPVCDPLRHEQRQREHLAGGAHGALPPAVGGAHGGPPGRGAGGGAPAEALRPGGHPGRGGGGAVPPGGLLPGHRAPGRRLPCRRRGPAGGGAHRGRDRPAERRGPPTAPMTASRDSKKRDADENPHLFFDVQVVSAWPRSTSGISS